MSPFDSLGEHLLRQWAESDTEGRGALMRSLPAHLRLWIFDLRCLPRMRRREWCVHA